MKPTLDIQHQGTIDTEDSVKMTFDENSIAHLMSVLTDLYSDPTTAVIREYSTNARDAQQEAGYDGPISITLPNPLNNIFIVEDCGVGMTAEQIKNQFSKYGWSSKRDSDTQTGMLGLGCKSGLAYAGQFTFYSTKDGTTSIVLVSRDPDGAASLQVLDESYTGQPNGTRIEIPVSKAREFNEKALTFFSFWRPGTVKFSDQDHVSMWAPSTNPDEDKFNSCTVVRVDEGIIALRDYPTSYIVMGGVPYPIMPEHGIAPVFLGGTYDYYSKQHKYGIVCEVDIGSVNFTPSREALQYTKRTEGLLKELNDYLINVFGKSLSERLSRCTNARQAWRVWTENTAEMKAFGIQPVWRGLNIPGTYIKSPSPYWDINRVRSSNDRIQRHNYPMDFGPGMERSTSMMVVNYPTGRPITSTFKDKLREYVRINNDKYRTVTSFRVFSSVVDEHGAPYDYFVDNAPWLDHIFRVEFSEVDAVSLDRRQRKKYEEKLIDGSFVTNRIGQNTPTLIRLDELGKQYRRVAWISHHDAKLVENRQGISRFLSALRSRAYYGAYERQYRYMEKGVLQGMRETVPIVSVVNASEQTTFEEMFPDLPHVSVLAREMLISTALHEPVGSVVPIAQDIFHSNTDDESMEYSRRWEVVHNKVKMFLNAFDQFNKFSQLRFETILDPELGELLGQLENLAALYKSFTIQSRYGLSPMANASNNIKELGSMDDQEHVWEQYRRLAIEILEIRCQEIDGLHRPMRDMVRRYPLVSQLRDVSSSRVVVDYLNALWLVGHGFHDTPIGAVIGSLDGHPRTLAKPNSRAALYHQKQKIKF